MKNHLLLLLLILLTFGCKKKNNETSAPQDNTPVQQQLVFTNIGENLIIPSYHDLVVQSDSLKSKVTVFCSSPNATTLAAAQDAWKQAFLAWQQCELFNFGPAATLAISNAVNYTPPNSPASINTSTINGNISSSSTIDSAYIETRTATAKGFTALEYLLFDHADNNTTILTNYTGDTYAAHRMLYVKGLCKNLHDKANLVYTQWIPTGGNYISSFEKGTGNDIYSSLSLLVNNMASTADNIKFVKLGGPLGINTGTVSPTAVEAYYSHYSFPCLVKNFTCLKYLLTGTGYGNMNGNGINILMNNSQEATTYNSSSSNLSTDLNYLSLITVTLETAVQNGDANTSALYLSAKQLLILFKSTMASELNISITFSDADGD